MVGVNRSTIPMEIIRGKKTAPATTQSTGKPLRVSKYSFTQVQDLSILQNPQPSRGFSLYKKSSLPHDRAPCIQPKNLAGHGSQSGLQGGRSLDRAALRRGLLYSNCRLRRRPLHGLRLNGYRGGWVHGLRLNGYCRGRLHLA